MRCKSQKQSMTWMAWVVDHRRFSYFCFVFVFLEAFFSSNQNQVCCALSTDCNAPWGRFVVCVIGLYIQYKIVLTSYVTTFCLFSGTEACCMLCHIIFLEIKQLFHNLFSPYFAIFCILSFFFFCFFVNSHKINWIKIHLVGLLGQKSDCTHCCGAKFAHMVIFLVQKSKSGHMVTKKKNIKILKLKQDYPLS